MDALRLAQINREHADCLGSLQTVPGVGLVCSGCGAVVSEMGATVSVIPDKTIVPKPLDPISQAMDAIDPSEILSPDEAITRIAMCVVQLERGAVFQRICIEEKYAADIAYELANARAIVAAEGAMDQRKAQALIKCEAEFTRKMVADMKVKAVAATMHDVRARLSGYQSASRIVQSVYGASGSGSF